MNVTETEGQTPEHLNTLLTSVLILIPPCFRTIDDVSIGGAPDRSPTAPIETDQSPEPSLAHTLWL